MAKTSKRKEDKKKKKKGKRMAPKAMTLAMKSKKSVPSTKENPFEAIWSRRKFDILGKKRKGEERRIGLARSRAMDKRKNTLLKEYERSGKASVFVDKRIGESNDQLQEFDKAIMRSQRQRQIKIRKTSKFNLSDGEEDELGISHLDDHDDYEHDGHDVDEADDDHREKALASMKQLSFNKKYDIENLEASDVEENKHKTRKQVMEEIIMKSKFFKAQKSKDKEENDQLMEKLDKSFALLVESPYLVSTNESSGRANLSGVVSNELLATGKYTDVDQQDKPDAYEKMYKEMSLEMRARPSDRTKTPEEIAQEERERLEKLEEERKKRMMAVDDSSDEDNDVPKQPRFVSGDDLGDSFGLHDEPHAKKGWVDEILDREIIEDSGDESSYLSDGSDSHGSDTEKGEPDENICGGETDFLDSKQPTLKDWEQSDDEHNVATSSDEDEQDDDSDDDKVNIFKLRNSVELKKLPGGERLVAKINKDDNTKNINLSDIPFVIDAPKNYEELCALMENRANADVVIIISRIRACNAIKLASENRKKIQVFYGILLQYFAVLASAKPVNLEMLNLLVKPLIEMSVEIPYFSAICARQRISRTRTQFCEAIKNCEDGCWPSFKTLSLLRLWLMAFPCSDFRHPVITPSTLLMCEYLMRCPIVSSRDIAVGSFMCSMILSLSKQSQKLYPEAISFLRRMLAAAIKDDAASLQELEFFKPTNLQALRSLLRIGNPVNKISPLNFPMVMSLPLDSSFLSSNEFRASLLFTVIETLKGFVETYKELTSFPELFLPISKLLIELGQQNNMAGILQNKFLELHHVIKTKVDEHHQLRSPLQMRKQKPVPIKLLNPKFEKDFVKGRDYDPDRERSERKKLRKLIAREAKGAARELRKDNYFLLEVKEKDKAITEDERTEKFGKTRAFLQEQEHAFKSGQLGKGRKRRR